MLNRKKNDDSDQIIHEEREKKTRTFFWFYMWYIWNSSSTSNPFFKRENIACPRLSYRWDLSQIFFQPVSFVSKKQYSTNSCIKYSIVANIFHTTFNILSTHLCVPPRTHTHISITNEPVHSLYLHCFLKTIVLFQVLQREIEERGKEINSLVRRCQPATDGAADGKNPTRLSRYARHLERSWHHIWIRSLENQCHTEQYLKRHSAVLVSCLIYRLLINLLFGFLHLWFTSLFCYIDSVVVIRYG